MNPPLPRPAVPRAVLGLLAMTLLAPIALAKVGYKPKPPAIVSCEALPGPPPEVPPQPRARVGLNFTAAMLSPGDSASVQVCALVDSLGVVRQARVERGGTPYDSAAVDAVHWWTFEPARRQGHRVTARVSVAVAVRPPSDADPLSPDVQDMAIQAEADGRFRDALDAWTGTLARAGVHPAIGNEWTIREHILRLAGAMGTPPEIPGDAERIARGAHNRMQRDISRTTNADLAKSLDEVLIETPWYAKAYRWRASARAASGQRVNAMRDVLCYQLATRDSAGLAVAERALVALAVGDTLTALSLLKAE